MMETVTRKIGNSVGVILPKELGLVVGATYSIQKIGNTILFYPKKKDIFEEESEWAGFRESVREEEQGWAQLEE